MSVTIPVLFEDASVMVFDKPAGIVVVPEPGSNAKTLSDIVNAEHPVAGEEGRLYPCHRLDRDTTGVIIYARGKSNQEKIMTQFRNALVQKKYIAFVQGKMRHPAGEIKSVIRDFHEQRFHTNRPRAENKGKMAITRYKTLAVKHLFSVVEVYPLTGRTNQIRIHFKELKHPLLGERLYALGRDASIKFRRVALHAREVTFKHPQTGAKITVECELAKDMENFVNRY